jgi:hypothetical protein
MTVILIIIACFAALWAIHFVVNTLLHRGEVALHGVLERKQERDSHSSTEL